MLLSTLAWDGFGQCKLIYILSQWEGFSEQKLRSILCPSWNGTGVLNTVRDTFCVLAFMGGFWSIQVEIHFVSSLARNGFGQHKLRHILCSHWYGRGLVNTC